VEINVYVYLYLKNVVDSILTGDEGQDLVEYALIIALVSIALVAALTALAGGISGVFSRIDGSMGT
jgi:pilus assembly protein Flp/PilA